MIAALYDNAGNLLPRSKTTIGNANTIVTIDGCQECVNTNDAIYDAMIISAEATPVPIIVYVQQDISTGFGTGNGDLVLTHCGNPNCTSGNVTTIVDGCATCTNNIDIGKHTAIELNASGNPVISYFNEGAGDLNLVVCGNINCSSGNTYTVVDNSADDAGQYISMILDGNYYPVITYFDATDDDLYFVHCGNTTCSSGNTFVRPLHGTNSSGQYSSIQLDGSGYPVIAFRDGATAHDLRLIHCTDANCSGTNSNIVTDATNSYKSGNGTGITDSAGIYNSLQLDGSGYPVISFGRGQFGSNMDLILAHCNDVNCAGSNETFNMLDGCTTGDPSGCSTTTDCASATASDCDQGDVGWYNKLQLDGSYYPVISYRSQAGGDLKVIHCNDVDCAGNNDSVARVDGCTGCDDDGTTNSTGAGGYTSLQLDASGKPVVSYRRVGVNGGSNNLKLVHCGNANCTYNGTGQTDPTAYQTARSAWFTPSLTGGASTRSLTLKVWVTGGTGYIQAARLKIVQTNSAKITDIQTQMELGDNQTITATTATELTNPKYYYYDSAKFSGTKSAYMEASLQGEGTGQGNGRLWSSGWELNSNTAGVEFDTISGTTALQNTTVRSGSYAGQINVTAASGRFQHALAASATDMDIYTRVYFRFASLPNGNTKIYFIGRAAANSIAVVYNNTNPHLDLNLCTNTACSTYTTIGSSSNNSITTNTWYRLEVHYDSTKAAGSDIVQAKLDGTSFGSSTAQTLATVTYTATGIVVDTVTANMFMDDWAVNNTTGSWPGPGKIIHLHPSSTGQNNDWTASAGTNYTTVDEVTPEDTDYVSTATINNIDDYYITGAASVITDGEAADINVVQVGVWSALDAAGSETFTAHISNNISESTDTGSTITDTTSTYGIGDVASGVQYTLTSYDIPGSATEKWTPAELDRSQIGINKTSSTAGQTVRVSTIWALVDYTPVADMTGTAVNAKLQQCDEASCSWTDVHATLGTVTNASASWKRIRTADLSANLTSGRLYRIVFWKSAASGTLKVANAKLIIGQTDAAGITTTQMVVHYVNTVNAVAGQLYGSREFLNYHDPANYYSGTFKYYFEADLKTQTADSTTAYAQLYNSTDSSAIASSEVTTTSGTYVRVRSGEITPPSTAKNLDTQTKNSTASTTTSVSNSWMIVDVTNFQIPEKIIYLLPLAILVPYFLKKMREQRERAYLWMRA